MMDTPDTTTQPKDILDDVFKQCSDTYKTTPTAIQSNVKMISQLGAQTVFLSFLIMCLVAALTQNYYLAWFLVPEAFVTNFPIWSLCISVVMVVLIPYIFLMICSFVTLQQTRKLEALEKAMQEDMYKAMTSDPNFKNIMGDLKGMMDGLIEEPKSEPAPVAVKPPTKDELPHA
jgi:hypothetical protein